MPLTEAYRRKGLAFNRPPGISFWLESRFPPKRPGPFNQFVIRLAHQVLRVRIGPKTPPSLEPKLVVNLSMGHGSAGLCVEVMGQFFPLTCDVNHLMAAA